VELTAEAIVELFRGDVRARKELAELLISEPDIRLAIINAVLRDVATKSDIEALRSEFRRELDSVRREIDMLAREIDRLYRLVMVSVLGILISIATTILVRVLLPP
jgi:ABC-type phosphate transport system auxiliary subunit